MIDNGTMQMLAENTATRRATQATNGWLRTENVHLREENARLRDALLEIAKYPVSVPGYNSVAAVRLRMVAMQVIARAALAAAE